MIRTNSKWGSNIVARDPTYGDSTVNNWVYTSDRQIDRWQQLLLVVIGYRDIPPKKDAHREDWGCKL